MTTQRALKPFLDKKYRDAYLEVYIRSGIASQIQALRKKLNLSQAEFGHLIGKTQSFVSHIEDNEYRGTVKILLEIAKSLNIGLEIRFVSYDIILDSDVSPSAYEMKDIHESYEASVSVSAATTDFLSIVDINALPAGAASIADRTPITYKDEWRIAELSASRSQVNRGHEGARRQFESVNHACTP